MMKFGTAIGIGNVLAFVSGILWGSNVAMLVVVGFFSGCILAAVCHNLINKAKD